MTKDWEQERVMHASQECKKKILLTELTGSPVILVFELQSDFLFQNISQN